MAWRPHASMGSSARRYQAQMEGDYDHRRAVSFVAGTASHAEAHTSWLDVFISGRIEEAMRNAARHRTRSEFAIRTTYRRYLIELGGSRSDSWLNAPRKRARRRLTFRTTTWAARIGKRDVHHACVLPGSAGDRAGYSLAGSAASLRRMVN